MKTIQLISTGILLLLTNSINAQTGSTKEQTIKELNNISFSVFQSELDDHQYVERWIKQDINFPMPEGSCLLTLSYIEDFIDARGTKPKPGSNYYTDKPIEMTIDMSKVSAIIPYFKPDCYRSYFAGKNGNNYCYNLYFILVIVNENNNEIKRIVLPIGTRLESKSEPNLAAEEEVVKTTKKYKVLNHLRKLCGALEPLKWD